MEYVGVRDGRKVWRSPKRDRFYTWDELHGEVEVFDKRGNHISVVDPLVGEAIKDPEPGRRLKL